MKLCVAVLMGMTLLAMPALAKDQQITIKDHQYVPDHLEVAVGDKVTWVNADQDPHNIIDKATPKTFHSPALDTDDEYAFTFTKAGIYRYFCTFHPTMLGEVIVK